MRATAYAAVLLSTGALFLAAPAFATTPTAISMEEAEAMPAQVIAQQPDGLVCEMLERFARTERLPEAWSREADRRGMRDCIDRGIPRDDPPPEREAPGLLCDPTDNVTTCR